MSNIVKETIEKLKKQLEDEIASPELELYRMNICKGCEDFIEFTGQCSNCWCFMKAKTKLKNVDCPKKKW